MKTIDGLVSCGRLLAVLVLALLGLAAPSSAAMGERAGKHFIGGDRHDAAVPVGVLCLGESKVGLKKTPDAKTPEQGGADKAGAPANNTSTKAAPAEVSSGTGDQDDRDTRRERRLQKRREELKKKADEAAKVQSDKPATAPAADGKKAGDATPLSSDSSSKGADQNTPPKPPQRHRFMWQARP